MKKIGILTGGADCPGLNSVIRAVVRKSIHEGYVVSGIKNGWAGLINNDMRVLDYRSTSGILDRGGTILGTSRLVPPLGKEKSKIIAENFKRAGMDALIAVGGEDTLKIALELHTEYSLPIVGVPKSIDNALSGTDYTFGFDTAVNVATECIDRLHTTAESHHRIVVIEVMGRTSPLNMPQNTDSCFVTRFFLNKMCQHLSNLTGTMPFANKFHYILIGISFNARTFRHNNNTKTFSPSLCLERLH